MTTYIAMWSGPRNISTAMMRAWESRQDCTVLDEPLYGYYLAQTQLPHPGAEEVIAEQGASLEAALERCLARPDGQEELIFQKHMVMHVLADVPLDHFLQMQHFFLIRHPRDVVSSYASVNKEFGPQDLGYEKMLDLYSYFEEQLDRSPVIIDSADFLRQPRAYLRALCRQLEIPFSENMLRWEKGPRDSDGVWAKFWYKEVQNSSAFRPYVEVEKYLDARNQEVCDKVYPDYMRMYERRMTIKEREPA